VLDALPCGIIVRDGTGHIVYANEEAHRIVGWPPGTLPGEKTVRRDGLTILNADGCANVGMSTTVFATRQPVNNVQQRLCFPGAGERWIHGNWWPVVDARGDVQRVVTAFVDITPSVEHANHKMWLENHVLQTLLGVALVLQNPTARRRAADGAREELDWAAGILRDLAKEVRRAAGSGSKPHVAASPGLAAGPSPPPAPAADSPPAAGHSAGLASAWHRLRRYCRAALARRRPSSAHPR
jgi:PAS domain-containing protein